MKYKVIYQISSSGSNRGLSGASFYTKAQAITSADNWRQIGVQFYAYYWDGSTWTEYAPIP
jgi:hypothetical protein